MSWVRFFRRKRSDAELQEEIENFLTEETADNEARGVSPDEARRQARITLGNPRKVRESLWTQNSPVLLTHAGRDFKYAFRTLSRTPGFSIIAIAVMALCIGAATSLFTIVRSVLLRPLPFRDPERLVMVYEHFRGEFNHRPVAPADFYDWRSKTHGFEDMAIMRYAGYNLTGVRNELPESVRRSGRFLEPVFTAGSAAGTGPELYGGGRSAWQRRCDVDLEPCSRGGLQATRRLWAARFTLTANPTQWPACCPRGSLIPMPEFSCGFPTRPMPVLRCFSITTGMGARWWRGSAQK